MTGRKARRQTRPDEEGLASAARTHDRPFRMPAARMPMTFGAVSMCFVRLRAPLPAAKPPLHPNRADAAPSRPPPALCGADRSTGPNTLSTIGNVAPRCVAVLAGVGWWDTGGPGGDNGRGPAPCPSRIGSPHACIL